MAQAVINFDNTSFLNIIYNEIDRCESKKFVFPFSRFIR